MSGPTTTTVAVAEFASRYPFGLDDFQLRACEAIAAGEGVLVAAPTGAGKTVVGEFAAYLAISRGQRCFYTAPIKALSNQKYTDLVGLHGVDKVGLLTGDTSRNGGAPVVVMTTEVLRNMIYNGAADGSVLDDLAFVVMDEVHYLADRQRGAVWEEVIIHLPAHVQLVSLSATVSNTEEFADWLVTVRGHTSVVLSEHRPVPLWQHVLVDRDLLDLFATTNSPVSGKYAPPTRDRDGGARDRGERDRERNSRRSIANGASPRRGAAGGWPPPAWPLPPSTSVGGSQPAPSGGGHGAPGGSGRSGPGPGPGPGDAAGGRAVNPELVRLAREESRPSYDRPRSGRNGGFAARPRQRTWVPSRPDVVTTLDRAGLLPAITFVFSRAGCDAAVAACAGSGLRLVTPDQQREIRQIVMERTADIPDGDRRVLGFWEFLDGLERGLAAHHAGMLPTFKEVVEELFVRGLVRAVFATETLALGINMPARTVVLERLTKFDGQARADITPGEYTQLTGRAGRRGIDVEGHAVVLWQPGLDPLALAGLASTRTYPLRSSFRPSYNMAVNLVGRLGYEQSRAVLESSFAQFQADRAVVGLARQVRRNLDNLATSADAMYCELGDVVEYDRLRRAVKDREAALSREGTARRRAEAAESLSRLRTGDVVRVPAGRRVGLAVVLDAGLDIAKAGDGPRPMVLTADRQVKRLSLADFPVAVEPLGRVRVPRSFNPRSPQSRKDLASSLRGIELPPEPGRRARERAAAADDAELARLRRTMKAHPVHGCADRDDHLRRAERHDRLRRETEALERRVDNRTNTVAKVFDRVRAVLGELGYLRDDTVTDLGRTLARIYTEQDLLVAECLRLGVWEELDPPALAGAVSALVFEPRGEDASTPTIPGGSALREALAATDAAAAQLADVEAAHELTFLRRPETGFVAAAHAWASGRSLEKVLTDTGTELTAGDFVRWMRQLIDLLDQVSQVAPRDSQLRRTARAAVDAVRRGVVAYSATV